MPGGAMKALCRILRLPIPTHSWDYWAASIFHCRVSCSLGSMYNLQWFSSFSVLFQTGSESVLPIGPFQTLWNEFLAIACCRLIRIRKTQKSAVESGA
jgi:hypothetical protein